MRLQDERPRIGKRRRVFIVIVNHDIDEAPFLAVRPTTLGRSAIVAGFLELGWR